MPHKRNPRVKESRRARFTLNDARACEHSEVTGARDHAVPLVIKSLGACRATGEASARASLLLLTRGLSEVDR